MSRQSRCQSASCPPTMTSLPKLASVSNPRPASSSVTGITTPKAHTHNYGPYPPPQLTSTWNQMKFPARINPLSPTYPKKRINMAWETTPQHWHNERRRLAMQQREHERYHSAWARPFYGPPADKEAYRKHFRETLKHQMADLDEKKRVEFKNKVIESERAVDYDNQCRIQDFNDFVKKFNYLKNFRDDNKSYMEHTWESNRFNKIMTDRYDREVMKYNPINWSGTLS